MSQIYANQYLKLIFDIKLNCISKVLIASGTRSIAQIL